tara:strand:- start:115 stop:360 length:246 start_codon:yes stop_codon:yes gene_type:complete
MKKDIEYNGYKSYNFWNQSLYINNDKSLYDLAIMCINKHNNIKLATLVFIDNLDYCCTPDNVLWTRAGVYSALLSLKKDNI